MKAYGGVEVWIYKSRVCHISGEVTDIPPRRPGSMPGHVEFMSDKVALGVGFLRAIRFPLPILIQSTAPHS
jgi:hypothetical protein